MAPAIKPIDLSLLQNMQEILSRSAGYEVSMDAEIEYFGEGGTETWFAALDDGRIAGFIRTFSRGKDWSNVEFFVDPQLRKRGEVAEALLKKFSKAAAFDKGHRLRIDLLNGDKTLNQLVQDAGYSQKRQLFRYFEVAIPENRKGHLEKQTGSPSPVQVAEVLSGLHPVTAEEAQKWLDNGSMRVLVVEDVVVSAAQIYVNDGSAEINRFASHPGKLRAGYARKLFAQLFEEFSCAGVRKCFLKVEDVRLPAISLYRSVGFTEVEGKGEIWHSRWY